MRFGINAVALAILFAAPSTNAFTPTTRAFMNRPGFALSSSVEKDQLIGAPDLVNGVSSPDAFGKEKAIPKATGTTDVEARSAAVEYISQFKGQSGASVIYSKLVENGVKVVNGYSGGAVLPLLDQFHEDNPRHGNEKAPIRWITNSNEASAGHVSEGYAKSCPIEDDSLPVGVLVATSGPGVTNIITPLQDAICDGVPVLALAGQAATTAPEDAFQQAPAVELCTPCTKWAYQIKSAAELPLVMDYAFFIARNGRPGPVFIDLPKDLQNQIVTDELIQSFVDNSLRKKDSIGDSFTKLVQKERFDGTAFQAIHLGYDEKGLAFEVEKEGDTFKVVPVSTDKAGSDMHHADHHPTNKIYGSNQVQEREGYMTADNAAFKKLQSMIVQAKRPIIIAGQGTNDCPKDLKEFAEKLQIPVTTTLHALGTFDERSDLACNMMGMHGHATPNFLIQEADLIINIGSRFDDRITGRVDMFASQAQIAANENRGGIIHVDIRLTEKNKQIDSTYFVHSTGKNFLQTMNKNLDKMDIAPKTSEWLNRKQKLQQDFPVPVANYKTEMIEGEDESGEKKTIPVTKLNAQSVVKEMDRLLVESGKIDDCIFTTGVGIHQMVAAQLITWTQPRQMLSSGSLGTMGVSLGYCIGAQLANCKKMVISVDGDGSFNMTFTELKTVAEEKIPVKLMILDNESQMMVEYWQRLFHDRRLLAVRNSNNPDYGKLADAFGIKNLYVNREEDLESVLQEFLFADPGEPVLLHVRIERTPCLPMVAPGQPLEDMILEDVDFEVDNSAAPS